MGDLSPKTRSRWAPPGRRCAAAELISICGATCRTPATRSSSSSAGLAGRRRAWRATLSPGGDARVVKIVQQALDGMPEGPIKADAPKVVLPDREKMKTQMEVAHLSLQDYYGRLCGAGGRGLSGRRVRHGQMGYYVVATARRSRIGCTCAIPASRICRRCERCAKAGCWPMWWRRLDPLILCWGRLTGECASGRSRRSQSVHARLWVIAWLPLLRSYTAAHGLNGDRQATVELGEEQITVRHGDAWLDLRRSGAQDDLAARRRTEPECWN